MKNISTIIGILAIFLGLVSCTKKNLSLDPDSEDFHEVSIILDGDLVSLSSIPLTKGTSGKAYYAFEVDSLHIVKYHIGDNYTGIDTVYFHYAEALYDNPTESNLRITLQNGHKYRIRCSIVIDGEETLYVNNDCIQEPFASYGRYGDHCRITNSFTYGEAQTVYAYNLLNTVRVNDGNVGGTNKWHAMVDRYYGETVTDGITAIKINLLRRNYGLHFKLVPPQKGTLKVYCDYGTPRFEYILNSNSSTIDEEHIYALDLVNNFNIIYLKVKWTNENGVVFDLSPEEFKVYNKTMINITVDINSRIIDGGSSNSGIGLVWDSDSMDSSSLHVS